MHIQAMNFQKEDKASQEHNRTECKYTRPCNHGYFTHQAPESVGSPAAAGPLLSCLGTQLLWVDEG